MATFKPPVTGEGMRKNWRSYRRGCERRFMFGLHSDRDACHFGVNHRHPHQLLQFLYRSDREEFLSLVVDTSNIGYELALSVCRRIAP